LIAIMLGLFFLQKFPSQTSEPSIATERRSSNRHWRAIATTPLRAVARWFDSYSLQDRASDADDSRPELIRYLPYVVLHAGCLGVIFVGWSWTAVAVAAGLYFLRVFAITAFYHRYFSHRAYKTSRPAQFVFALLGNSAAQRGPLWWAAQHRHHHAHSDDEEDAHSPKQHGFYWAHIGWLTERRNLITQHRFIPDFARYPELRWLDRFDFVVPLALLAVLFGVGEALRVFAPGLNTSGAQLVVWGFFISTVLVFHATCCINSLAHVFGTRRYETRDDSRNSLLLALLTFGEGWHNNHHRYAAAARQGFFWWEIDITYYILRGLAGLGIVWDLKPVPRKLLAADLAPSPKQRPAA
jgi:stearoyl-CoA desaturase (delta-9 desaturase)